MEPKLLTPAELKPYRDMAEGENIIRSVCAEDYSILLRFQTAMKVLLAHADALEHEAALPMPYREEEKRARAERNESLPSWEQFCE